jgi:hypothetical protein
MHAEMATATVSNPNSTSSDTGNHNSSPQQTDQRKTTFSGLIGSPQTAYSRASRRHGAEFSAHDAPPANPIK